jgi:hypothetical protein
MAPWSFHEIYKAFDVKDIPGYPNQCLPEWWEDCPKFDGDQSLAIPHAINVLKHVRKIKLELGSPTGGGPFGPVWR